MEAVDAAFQHYKVDTEGYIRTGIVYYDGSDPYKMHNYYTYLYNKTVFEVLEEYYGKDKACLFARSATVGGQQFPVHWGGDCFSNYESMWETVRAYTVCQAAELRGQNRIPLPLRASSGYPLRESLLHLQKGTA